MHINISISTNSLVDLNSPCKYHSNIYRKSILYNYLSINYNKNIILYQLSIPIYDRCKESEKRQIEQ